MSLIVTALVAWIATCVVLTALFVLLAMRLDFHRLEGELRFACDERDTEARLRSAAYHDLAKATNHPCVSNKRLRSVR